MGRPEMHVENVDGVELELFDRGRGEPVVILKGGLRDEWSLVFQEPGLTDRFRVVQYFRRGWGRSTRRGLPLSIADQAADCRAVMEHLGLDRAHLVGMSYGGTIALQVVKDHPEVVHSLALLEPAFPPVLARYPEVGAAIGEAVAHFQAGDPAAAVRAQFSELLGPDFQEVADRKLDAGWFDRLVEDADTLYRHDGPALEDWTYSRDDAARITQPVLTMMGAHTRPYYRETCDTLQSWIPHAESVVLPGSSHEMTVMDPRGVAENLAAFFSRHPLSR